MQSATPRSTFQISLMRSMRGFQSEIIPEVYMKKNLFILIVIILTTALAACTSQPAEPTPTEIPPTITPPPSTETIPHTEIPPTSTPLPEQVEVVRAFYEAFSEDRVDEALGYLAEDVGLLLPYCLYGEEAWTTLKEWMEVENPVSFEGDNYKVSNDQVDLYAKIVSNKALWEGYDSYGSEGVLWEGFTSYVVQDGQIKSQSSCKPK